MSDYINGSHLPDEEESPKKRRFRIFDTQREGRGVTKEDAKVTPDLGGFFRGFGRSFTKLLSVNLMTLVGNFPLLFAILALSGIFKVAYMMPVSGLFADLHALMILDPARDPATMAAFGALGVQIQNTAMTTMSYVLFGLSALTLLTFGCTKVGTTYILRSMIRGEPAFLLSDFKHAIKRNWRQALPIGIIDLAAFILFPVNIFILLESGGTFLNSVLLWTNILFFIVFLFMRPYVYLQMITFDLKFGKLIKNSLIFALLGFKRNILAFFGLLIMLLIMFVMIFGIGGALLPLGIAIPLVILFSGASFMADFAAWFKIHDVMIAPADTAVEE